MADVDNTTPVEDRETPKDKPKDKPKDTDKKADPEAEKINALIQEHLSTFGDNFIKKFNEQYEGKLSQLKSDCAELDEKKQHMAVLDEMKTAKMDSSLIDFVYDKDIEVSKVKIEQLNKLITEEVQRGVETRLKGLAYTPPADAGDSNFSGSQYKRPSYVV